MAAPAATARLTTPRRDRASAHTDNSTAPRPTACTPQPLRPASFSRFSDHALQRFAMQTQLRHKQLQTTVLVLQLLQPLRLGHVHAAQLLLPVLERHRTDPVHTAQIRRLHRTLALLQDPNDLLFTETASSSSPSVLSSLIIRKPQFQVGEFLGDTSRGRTIIRLAEMDSHINR